MDIIVAVRHHEYNKFIHDMNTNIITYKYFDEYEGLFYYDAPRKLTMLMEKDFIFFYIKGYVKYYAKVIMIQEKIIPPNSIRIYFSKLELNENCNDKQFLIKPFYGIRYFCNYIIQHEEHEDE